MSTWKDACHLRLAFRCLEASVPDHWREVVEACRQSKRERKRVLHDLRTHFWWPAIAHLHGVAP